MERIRAAFLPLLATLLLFAAVPARAGGGTLYLWKDVEGVTHLSGGAPPRNPASRVRTMATKPQATAETKVTFANNQVLVPVNIHSQGRVVTETMLLDTGANTSMLHKGLADKLGLVPLRETSVVVADGRRVPSSLARVDIEIGPHRLDKMLVHIVSTREAEAGEHRGLIGMDFLEKFRYDLGLPGQRIIWR